MHRSSLQCRCRPLPQHSSAFMSPDMDPKKFSFQKGVELLLITVVYKSKALHTGAHTMKVVPARLSLLARAQSITNGPGHSTFTP